MSNLGFGETERLKKILEQYLPSFDTIDAFARAVGIKPVTFGCYLRGERFPGFENQLKIAKFMGISHEEFVNRVYGFDQLKARESGNCYKVRPISAEECVEIVGNLPDSEKLKLARFLMNDAIAG